jgi:ribosome-associated protein
MEKLETLPLTDILKQAIVAAKSIKSHGAKRRQAQLIGKLMRSADSETILNAYEHLCAEDSTQTATFHAVEQWRERLLQGNREALTEFVASFQPDDVQHLRQLIKKAIEEQTKEKHTGASKALFRYIRNYIQ